MGQSGSGQARSARPDSVRIFEADPDLAKQLPVGHRRRLERQVVEPLVRLRSGEALRADLLLNTEFVVLEGHLLGEVELFARKGVELIGPRDVIRSRDPTPASLLPKRSSLTALTRFEAAVLGSDFRAATCRFPQVARRLLARAVERSERLATQHAIAQISGIAARLDVLFWHLAEHWGRREKDRTVIPFPLRQAVLADLASAQRESVSRNLAALREMGIVDRDQSGCWSLRGFPPQTAEELLLIRGRASELMLRKPAQASESKDDVT